MDQYRSRNLLPADVRRPDPRRRCSASPCSCSSAGSATRRRALARTHPPERLTASARHPRQPTTPSPGSQRSVNCTTNRRYTCKTRRSIRLLALPIAAAMVAGRVRRRRRRRPTATDATEDTSAATEPAATEPAATEPAATEPPHRAGRHRTVRHHRRWRGRALAGVCPDVVTIQTDWNPEAEHGCLYEMVGDDYDDRQGRRPRARPARRAAASTPASRSRSAPADRRSASRPSRRSSTPTTTSCSATSTPTRAIQNSAEFPTVAVDGRLREEPADDHVGPGDVSRRQDDRRHR